MKLLLILLPLVGDLDQDGVSAEEGDHSHQYQVLEGYKHVQLEPEAVVETKDGSQAKVETNAWRRERHVGHVDADLEPADEHDEDGGEAQEGEGVWDNWRGTNLWLPERVPDFRFNRCLQAGPGLETKDGILSAYCSIEIINIYSHHFYSHKTRVKIHDTKNNVTLKV